MADLASQDATISTGSALLDRFLPGGGWPLGALVEILQPASSQHGWQLLLPALVLRLQQQAGPLVLVGPPWQPFGPSLRAQGLAIERLLLVQAQNPAARLWATEQALRCAQVAAVLAWLPAGRTEELRRLHLAAQQHGRLLFVFRGLAARFGASPAVLRLLVEGDAQLQVRILKRRGPPVEQVITLCGVSARMSALLASRKSARNELAVRPRQRVAERSHGMDRSAASH